MSTILAVDDSATMRKCLEITFDGTEHTVVTCDSANAALEQVKTIGPDLVIADVALGADDGYELCSTIKLAAPGVPVLMLSSKQNPFDAGKGAQADAHIDKPFDTQVMQDKAKELLSAAPRSDTDMPGAPAPGRVAAPPAVKPAAPASSKIPAPRRKRPTPAMMAAPAGASTPKPPTPVAQAAGRRTVPFAMPSGLKKPGEGGVRKTTERTQPMDQQAKPRPAPVAQRPAPPPVKPATPAQPNVQPKPMSMPSHDDSLPPPTPQQSPAAAPEITVSGGDGAAAEIPAAAAADLQTKLQGLGLTEQQVQGVLALSREVVEHVVWEVVPTLAETLIKEELARLTKE